MTFIHFIKGKFQGSISQPAFCFFIKQIHHPGVLPGLDLLQDLVGQSVFLEGFVTGNKPITRFITS